MLLRLNSTCSAMYANVHYMVTLISFKVFCQPDENQITNVNYTA